MKLSNRRIDPRTDSSYSLQNLLRVRSERHTLALALLLTPDGILMAGNQVSRAAERLAAHTARELFLDGAPERLSREAPRTGARLACLRVWGPSKLDGAHPSWAQCLGVRRLCFLSSLAGPQI